MIGVGGISLAGRALGQSRKDRAINLFNQTYVTALFLMLLLALISYFSLPPIIQRFNLAPILSHNFLNYYKIILMAYPLMMLNIVGGMFIRGEGKPQLFMVITLIMNLINIILDYYFIVYMKLGISGAALASALSISIGYLSMTIFFIKFSDVFRFKPFHFSLQDLKETAYNGSSELIGQLSFSITNFLFNAVVLSTIGISGIAAMTLAGYSGYLFNMIIIGFGQGISPMISFSYGAENRLLCTKLKDETINLATGIGLFFYLLLAIGAPIYSQVFTKDVSVSQYMLVGLRIYSLSFILIAYNVLNSFYFTAIGNPKESAVISASRGLIIISILIFILPHLFGMLGVWLVAPITELLTAFITHHYSKHEYLRYPVQT